MTDPQGRKRPMLDQHGNLTVEAIRLYAAGALGAADVEAMDQVLANDPFAAEALAGLKGMASDRFNTNMREVDDLLVERLGVEPDAKLEEDSPWLRMAATLLILMGIGGVTWLGVQYLPRLKPDVHDMGMAAEKRSVPASRPEPAAPPTTTRPSFDVKGIQPAPAATDLQPVQESMAVTEDVQTATAQSDPAQGVSNTRKKAEEIVKSLNMDAPAKIPAREPQVQAAAPAERPFAPRQQAVQPTTGAVAEDEHKAVQSEERVGASRKKEKDAVAQSAPIAAKRNSAVAEMVNQAPMSDEDRSRIPMFNEVQQPPKFPGGDLEMYRYIESNRGFQNTTGDGGNVYVSFVIDASGKVSDVQLSRGIRPELDQDALRLVRTMPRWEPARDNGANTPVRKTVMIKYR
jgi:protein TonB